LVATVALMPISQLVFLKVAVGVPACRSGRHPAARKNLPSSAGGYSTFTEFLRSSIVFFAGLEARLYVSQDG
jgi:hypothetical protein